MIASHPGEVAMDSGDPDFERLFLENVDLIERLCRFVCRSSRMQPAEIEDFSSHVKLKLFENDYAILRKFQNRSSLSSYLVVVIQRMLTDYRIHHWGKKWHSSAEAVRLGPLATRLETLLNRDQKSVQEAFQILRDAGEAVTLPALEQLAARFPRRTPRPTLVAIETAGEAETVAQDDESAAQALPSDRLAACQSITEAVRSELGRLPAADLAILRLHFYGGMSVAEIARVTHRDQKALYKHIHRLYGSLRKGLVARGVDTRIAADLIGRTDSVFDFGIESEEKPPLRPSFSKETEMQEGPSAK
jgi:RNA polymerase sigma factor (sigma-70 family)